MIRIVRVAIFAVKTVCSCTHFQIKTILDRFVSHMSSAPIGYYGSIKAPFLLKYLIKNSVVVA